MIAPSRQAAAPMCKRDAMDLKITPPARLTLSEVVWSDFADLADDRCGLLNLLPPISALLKGLPAKKPSFRRTTLMPSISTSLLSLIPGPPDTLSNPQWHVKICCNVLRLSMNLKRVTLVKDPLLEVC